MREAREAVSGCLKQGLYAISVHGPRTVNLCFEHQALGVAIPRRNHTREFKLQCCRQAATGEKRPAEEVYIKEYRTFEEAPDNIARFIEEVYNEKRLQPSPGYLPPVEFEALHALKVRS